jgi:DNA helicase HerA-like ATPase
MEFNELDELLGNLEKHISIIGKTNTGKTTAAKMLHDNTDKISIFFNTQDEDVQGHQTKKWDIKDLKEHRKINFIPHWNNDIATIQLKEIVQDLRKITESIGDRSRKTRFIVFVDESHEIAPNNVTGTPLHFIMKRGKRYGITGVSITQRPAELDLGIVSQANYHMIFDVNDFESQYFKKKNIPIEQVKPQLVDTHNFTIYDNRSFTGIYTLRI